LTYKKNKSRLRTDGKGILLVLGDLRQNLLHRHELVPAGIRNAIYVLALGVSIGLWCLAIRAPLWLDETTSYWQINAGFAGIAGRHSLYFPAYFYILWFFTKILGTSELALRATSIPAMVGAVYLLYRSASELFERDIAFIVSAIFAMHRIVIFLAIDVRPYAFAALAINSAIFALVRMRHSDSTWLAMLLGLSAAFIVYFHLLFIVLMPALVICFFAVASTNQKLLGPPLVIALATFAVAFLPTIPYFLYLFRTSESHNFDLAPKWSELGRTLAPLCVLVCCGIVLFLAAATHRLNVEGPLDTWRIAFCASLGLLPLLILFGVSVATPIHIFAFRYQLSALPGVALCWGWILSRVNSRLLRLLFCVAAVGISIYLYVTGPDVTRHGVYPWKYALEVAEENAAPDNAPVLMCSQFIESNFMPMPSESVKDSFLFAPLSYYKLSVPVVPLPAKLNEETTRIASAFLLNAAAHHQHFFAVAAGPSFPTLQWIVARASQTHHARVLGVFEKIAVVEFTPQSYN
jgi:hypothetical protein